MSKYGDGEYAAVHSAEWRSARKERNCHACHELIRPGQRYHRTFVVFDGSPDYWVRCERCQTIFKHISDRMRTEGDHDEYCNPELNCGHEYRDRWDEEPPPEIAALAFWLPGDPLP